MFDLNHNYELLNNFQDLTVFFTLEEERDGVKLPVFEANVQRVDGD